VWQAWPGPPPEALLHKEERKDSYLGQWPTPIPVCSPIVKEETSFGFLIQSPSLRAVGEKKKKKNPKNFTHLKLQKQFFIYPKVWEFNDGVTRSNQTATAKYFVWNFVYSWLI
jgi:hypothetical protein